MKNIASRLAAPKPFFASFAVFAFAVPALFVGIPARAQTLQAAPANKTGVYKAGETLAWDVTVSGENAASVSSVTYQVKRSGGDVVASGTLPMTGGTAHLSYKPTEPMAYLTEFKAVGAKTPEGKDITALGGALLSPEKIAPVQTRPADFDKFWAAKIAELRAIPANPVLTEEPSGKENVRYFKLTLQNVKGKTVYAQMAYPAAGSKFPGLVLLQYAGVYALHKDWVTNRAAQGWLAINVMAHDLPIDKSPEFYKEAAETALKGYATQGNDDRETSYMLGMILGDVRAADYLTSRTEWDNKTLVVEGSSQGGYQSFALAGLYPKVSAVSVQVPAGCDLISKTGGREQGWPYWLGWGPTPKNAEAMIQTSRYFDPVNFASAIRVPCLVALGLIDVTSPPANVYGAINHLRGPKEVVVMPLSQHKSEKRDGVNTQAAYSVRSGEWLRSLQKTGAPPAP